MQKFALQCFKPCYKWNTFNTIIDKVNVFPAIVLNLVISGIPSILEKGKVLIPSHKVLNLVISRIPSIHNKNRLLQVDDDCFKPYYKWNTFNTEAIPVITFIDFIVLNLIINGIPSILETQTS